MTTPTQKSNSMNSGSGSDRDVPSPPRRLSSFGSDISDVSVSTATTSCSHRSVSLIDIIDEEFVVKCGATTATSPMVRSSKRLVSRTTPTRGGNKHHHHHYHHHHHHQQQQQQQQQQQYYQQSRKDVSILDMIDRISLVISGEDDDGNKDESSCCMTNRSYPRGVYVVPAVASSKAVVSNTTTNTNIIEELSDGKKSSNSNINRSTALAFVSAEAINQWQK